MHDPRKLREEAQEYRRRLRRRGADGLLDEALKVDEDRLSVLRRVEELRAERNRASQEIAGLRKAGKDAQAEIERMRGVGEELKAKEAELAELEGKVQELWLQIPNVPSDDMPDGLEPREERVVFERPRFGFEPKAHWEIGTNLGILDFDRATRMSGSRFALQRGLGAKLERALIDFMIDVHTSRGYTEIFPPFLVQEPALYGTGQLPKFREEMFQTQTGHFLISTAEVPVTNMHREEILPDDELPIRYCAYSACFRAEAGAAGRDTRGLIRLHQFNKVEIVHFVRPEESDRELDLIVDEAEEILRRLELHYRVVTLPTMDYGFSAYKTLDLEVWLPSQDMFREISSATNFRDFQARRANIRYRDQDGKVHFVHTLNASGLAVGRTMAAILEQYQDEDGSVRVPQALRPYMGVERIGPR
jgi:seryl-tRNA synthetase